MSLDAILEIAIGLVVTWLILSVATVQVQDWIADKLNWRAAFMEEQLKDMLKNPQMVKEFYKHPLIQAMHFERNIPWWRRRGGQKTEIIKPSQISNPVFASAALDVFLNAGKTGDEIPAKTMSIQGMKKAMEQSLAEIGKASPDLARSIRLMSPNLNVKADQAEKALADFRTNIETWFDNAMIKATQVYKQNAQWYAFIIGLATAIIFNVDSINVMNKLWQEPTLRAAIVAQAPTMTQDPGNTVKDTIAQMSELSLPVGWTTIPAKGVTECANPFAADGKIIFSTNGGCRQLVNVPLWNNGWGYFYKLLGFIISGVAASQGAPFWFDSLNKLLGLKSGQVPKKTEKEKV